ncbi:hypothetical protein EZV62_023230 [Acer yangbiense]|uniref:CCHC-type domain-containing protein n=1 Tax=Acer yangbiense TaxID=1000413 RepID=A0A5C7H370_9ROSI|nr:hypothetical protein EZV62_023230 [Acer yangbiense]
MNRRTTKWLAEQIGVVVEIPYDSRECWGKFLWVKVQINITKPLKRWLRLKLGKTEDIVVVGLKYERLSDFCFVCGRIGHLVKECTDEVAREVTAERRTETLTSERVMGTPQTDRMVIDRPISGQASSVTALRQTVGESSNGPMSVSTVPILKEASPRNEEPIPKLEVQMHDAIKETQEKNSVQQVTPIKKTGKKWKRAARGVDQLQLVGKVSSPLQRMLVTGKVGRKTPKSQCSPKTANGKSPGKCSSKNGTNSPLHSPGLKSEGGSKVCKRKVVFDLSKVARDLKKGKIFNPKIDPMRSAEPIDQARRDQ